MNMEAEHWEGRKSVEHSRPNDVRGAYVRTKGTGVDLFLLGCVCIEAKEHAACSSLNGTTEKQKAMCRSTVSRLMRPSVCLAMRWL